MVQRQNQEEDFHHIPIAILNREELVEPVTNVLSASAA